MIDYVCTSDTCPEVREQIARGVDLLDAPRMRWSVVIDRSDARVTGWVGPAADDDVFCPRCGEQGEPVSLND